MLESSNILQHILTVRKYFQHLWG